MAAKQEAFKQCRVHQNAAYLSCESMFKHGVDEFAPSPGGSGSGIGMGVADPMQFQEATVVHESIVPKGPVVTTTQSEGDETDKYNQEFNALLHPSGEQEQEQRPRKQWPHVSDDSSQAVHTVDRLFKQMGADEEHNDNEDPLDPDLGDIDLFQEADLALRSMGFPPLP